MKQNSRRKFIQSSLVAGLGAISFPTLLPGRIWAAEVSPNSKITVGFVGMGRMSRKLMEQFLNSSAKVVAVCDVDTVRREDAKRVVDEFYSQQRGGDSVGQKSAGCAAYGDFRELIARADIDAVCIATPDHWHAIITLAALKAGKDVYCEKPLTHNIHEALVVMKTVRASGRILQTGSMQRSSSEFRVACELVRNGVIGKITTVECDFGPPPKPCDLPGEKMENGLNWDMWLGPAPERPYNSVLSPRGIHKHFPNWRNYSEYGGGKVADWGAHHIDIAQWGLGMDESGPVKIIPPASADSQSGAQMVYANGVILKHVDGFGVDFMGTEGRVRVNRGKFIFERDGKVIASFTDKDKDEDTSLKHQVGKAEKEYLSDAKIKLRVSQNHVSDFLECVGSRQPPITHAEIGGRSAICCHLINMVYRNRQNIRWDPVEMAFPAGFGDAKWLTREYRGNWKV